MELFKTSKIIKNLKIHESSGNFGDTFVGIKFIGNEIYFYYPKYFSIDLNSKKIREDILLLLSTIKLAKTKSNELSYFNDKRINGDEFALQSYLWIINDYVNNGLYLNRIQSNKINHNGKVDWKKTIQKNSPIISNGRILYKDLYVTVNENKEDVISLIYKHCLKTSLDYIGWIFNMSGSFIEDSFNDDIKSLYIEELRKEQLKTFNDKKNKMLKHLKNILLGLDFHNNDTFIYGVDSYNYVFERMIDKLFGNQKTDKFNPKADWHLIKGNSFIDFDSTHLRPDTVFEDFENNNLYIIDSKYYKYGSTIRFDDLPESSSIQKQIAYGYYAKHKFFYKNVYNCFILPYDSKNNPLDFHNWIEYIGYAKLKLDKQMNSFEIIYAFVIDLRYLMENYCKCNTLLECKILIDNILKQSAKVLC